MTAFAMVSKILADFKVVRNKNGKFFIALCDRAFLNEPPFLFCFSYRNSTLKLDISLCSKILGQELCKRDRIMKTRPAININDYRLRLALFFEKAYSNDTDLILNC